MLIGSTLKEMACMIFLEKIDENFSCVDKIIETILEMWEGFVFCAIELRLHDGELTTENVLKDEQTGRVLSLGMLIELQEKLCLLDRRNLSDSCKITSDQKIIYSFVRHYGCNRKDSLRLSTVSFSKVKKKQGQNRFLYPI
jgi:hypothetical protein